MSPTTDIQETTEKKNGSVLESGWADFVGAALTILSGGIAGLVSINNHFFSNTEKDALLGGEARLRNQALKDLHIGNSPITGQELRNRYRAIGQQYDAAVKAKLKKVGLSDPWHKFITLHPHQRTEVALTMMAVTAVALGAVVSLIGTRRVGIKQDELEHEFERRLDEINGHSPAPQR